MTICATSHCVEVKISYLLIILLCLPTLDLSGEGLNMIKAHTQVLLVYPNALGKLDFSSSYAIQIYDATHM